MGKYRVIGELEVGGVAPGGTVELDESKFNIAALITSGHVEPIGQSKPARGEAKDGKG